jgi:hypothetical protein
MKEESAFKAALATKGLFLCEIRLIKERCLVVQELAGEPLDSQTLRHPR